MKKILCFIDSLGHGGAQRQIVGLASMLQESGYDVSVIAYHDILFYNDELERMGIGFTLVGNNVSRVSRIFEIWKYIKQLKPDVVISFLGNPSIIACLIKMCGEKYKLIVSERNITRKLTIKERFKFWMYGFSDTIVSNSYCQDEFVKKNYKSLSSKAHCIPNFTDTDLFSPCPLRKSMNIKRITVFASMIKSKNAHGLIVAVKNVILQGYDNFIVDWYGETPHEREYADERRKQITELNISKYFHIHPRTHKVNEILQDSDFFCLPSFYEGTPNALCEAISCGLPSICSDVSDNSLYVQNNINGFIFDPYNIKSIEDSIIKILSLSSDAYSDFSRNSRNIAIEKLSKKRFINQYLEIIEA